MSASFVKYCPSCEHENSSVESFCSQCDFDLLAVPAEARHAEATEAGALATAEPGGTFTLTPTLPAEPVRREVCRLELIDNPAVAFEIAPGQCIGRGLEADVIVSGMPHGAYISRRHAAFSCRNGQWFAQYVGTGNFIKVDGEMSEDDSMLALHDGAVLTLSLTSFRVVLR